MAIGADEVIPLPHPSVNPGAFGNGNELVGFEFDAGAFEASGRAAKIGAFGADATGCDAGCGRFAAGITGATGAAGRGATGFGSTRGAAFAGAGASTLGAIGVRAAGATGAAGRAGAAATGTLGAVTRSPGNRIPQNPATTSVNSSSTYPLTFR